MPKKATRTETESTWTTTKIRRQLLGKISVAVGGIKTHGVPKYASNPDFIQKACIELLNKEGVTA